jgi:hypothetical protein
MKLVFTEPVKLSALVDCPSDTTPWPDQRYFSGRHGHTPIRPRASFRTWQSGALARNGNQLAAYEYGVYILALDIPRPCIYVGVAGEDRKTPEGIATRIAKHRVKATGSHVGAGSDSTGGVNHTGGWRSIAPARYRYFEDQGATDTCEDMRLVIGRLDQGSSRTSTLEYFEHSIVHDAKGCRQLVERILWPDATCLPAELLTTASKAGVRPREPVIRWWSGESTSL